MATININPPAKISRNTAADGDFLWKQDFEVLYNNDIALRNAIEQGAKEITPSSGINIDTNKNISVNKGKGLKFNGNALEVDITGDGGADVTYDGNKIVVSGYDPTKLINDVSELEDSLDVFSESLEQLEKEAITSADSMQPGTQYVYTTSGWVPIAGGSQQEISYWRPTYNSSNGKIEWEMHPSPSVETPKSSNDLRGTNGQTPKFRVNQSTNFWEWKYVEDPKTTPWTSTNTSATGPQGAKGETGAQGFSIELDSVETVPGGKEITLKWGDSESPSTSAFIIPSGDKGSKGDPGDKGVPGDNGYTPSVSAKDIDTPYRGKQITFYWPAAAGKSDVNVDIEDGFSPTVSTSKLEPTTEHTNGGSAYTIVSRNTTNTINIWHGNDGTATVNCEGTYITGNGTASNVIKPTEKTKDILQSVSGKVNKPDTSLTDKYLVLRTNTDGTVSGWCDLSDQSYSKSEADGRYVQQTFIDNTLSGTGANANNKLGVNTGVIPTMDWLDDNYLPLSGGIVSGQLTISGNNFNNNLHLKRDNNEGFIGLAGNGAITFKNSVNGSTSQIEFLTSDNKTFDITVKDNSTTPQQVGKLYVMSAHSLADATATSANWANDGMLHIILDS